jgi:hypothetical protein
MVRNGLKDGASYVVEADGKVRAMTLEDLADWMDLQDCQLVHGAFKE